MRKCLVQSPLFDSIITSHLLSMIFTEFSSYFCGKKRYICRILFTSYLRLYARFFRSLRFIYDHTFLIGLASSGDAGQFIVVMSFMFLICVHTPLGCFDLLVTTTSCHRYRKDKSLGTCGQIFYCHTILAASIPVIYSN